jgi:stalled ribosome alternative rescue factor ArfA
MTQLADGVKKSRSNCLLSARNSPLLQRHTQAESKKDGKSYSKQMKSESKQEYLNS